MEKVEFEETGGALPPPPPLLPPHGRPERLTYPPKRVAISRTGTRRSGRHINLVANHFKVAVNVPDAVFFQYSVLIKSEDNQEVVEGSIGWKVMDKLYHTYSSELAGKNIVCHGEKALYTVGSLPQKKFEFTVVLEEAAVKRGSPDLTGMETDHKRTKGSFRSKTFSVEISFAARIPLKPIALALKGLEAENTDDALKVIDIILGQQGAKRGCLVRPSFFHDDVRNFVNVDGGVTAFRGFHSSFRTTQGGLSLNMDVSTYMPCLDVGKLKRPNYLPLELCSLISLERYTKALSSKQRASLVEKSRQKPQERIRTVTDAVKNYRYDDDPMLKACGISLEKQLTDFEGRVLNAPTLKIGNCEDCVPHDGRWNFNHKRLFSLIQIKRWAVVNFSARCDMSYLSQELIKCGQSKGIHIDNPHSVIEEDSQWRRSGLVVRVEKLFEQVKTKLLGPWKKKNLHEMGIFTQCLSPTKLNGQYLTNVLLKINSKLGGLNSLLEVERIPTIPRLKKTPTMILGMDVSHGSPGQSDVPSIAAVVKTQSPKVEMIDSLFKLLPNGEDDGIIRELLVEFYKSSQGRKPEQIIIFRLFEECFQRRWYHTAACYILLIAKLEGPAVSQYCALRLLQEYLQRERSGSNCLESFASGLELINQKVRFYLFRHDMRLWSAYSSALQSEPAFSGYGIGKHGLFKEKPARTLATLSNPLQMMQFRHFCRIAAPENEALGRWSLEALNNLGLGLPIVTVDGQLLDQRKGERYSTGGYAQDRCEVLLWFLSNRYKSRKKNESLASCQLYSELVAILQGAATAKLVGFGRYWMRSDSKNGIAYFRRAFSRFVRSNDVVFAVQPLKEKFRYPIMYMLSTYSTALPRMIRIPGSKNLLANWLANNAPKLLDWNRVEYRSFDTSLPKEAEDLWLDTE